MTDRIMGYLAYCLFALVIWSGFSTEGSFVPGDVYKQEKAPAYWHDVAQEELLASLKDRQRGVAKNVIFFLGDGLGVSSVTAGRILAGQRLGKKGEEHKLSFDKFPYTGLAKVYTLDFQIPDSAATATAFLSGVKTKYEIIGMSGEAVLGNCTQSKGTEVDSILHWAQRAGKSTGVISNAKVTHATPAAVYAHSPHRKWESDRYIPESERECEDIASQLITKNKDINVILGGGRGMFYPSEGQDPDPNSGFNLRERGRIDGRNLVEEWEADKESRNLSHKFVYNTAGFNGVDASQTDYLLGLFAPSYMNNELDRDPAKEPSMAEMTEKAINILKKNRHGFFLFIESGLIDRAHHVNEANRALSDVIALDEAVKLAIRLTDSSNTLIVVSADHSHVIAMGGYAQRGAPILGLADFRGTLQSQDQLPYTTLMYGNGPGYGSPRQNITGVNTEDKEYKFQSAVPMRIETHSGEDVAIYATGPQSFLYSGTHEQNYIPMVMAYAMCVGPYGDGGKPCAKYQEQHKTCINDSGNSSSTVQHDSLLVLLSGILIIALNFI